MRSNAVRCPLSSRSSIQFVWTGLKWFIISFHGIKEFQIVVNCGVDRLIWRLQRLRLLTRIQVDGDRAAECVWYNITSQSSLCATQPKDTGNGITSSSSAAEKNKQHELQRLQNITPKLKDKLLCIYNTNHNTIRGRQDNVLWNDDIIQYVSQMRKETQRAHMLLRSTRDFINPLIHSFTQKSRPNLWLALTSPSQRSTAQQSAVWSYGWKTTTWLTHYVLFPSTYNSKVNSFLLAGNITYTHSLWLHLASHLFLIAPKWIMCLCFIIIMHTYINIYTSRNKFVNWTAVWSCSALVPTIRHQHHPGTYQV